MGSNQIAEMNDKELEKTFEAYVANYPDRQMSAYDTYDDTLAKLSAEIDRRWEAKPTATDSALPPDSV